MKKDQVLGLMLLIGGIILIYLYAAFQALQNIASIPIVIGIGVLAVIIGIILFLNSKTPLIVFGKYYF